MTPPISHLHDTAIVVGDDNGFVALLPILSLAISIPTSVCSTHSDVPSQLCEHSLTYEIIVSSALPIHVILACNLIILVHSAAASESARRNLVIAVTQRFRCRLRFCLGWGFSAATTATTAPAETGERGGI